MRASWLFYWKGLKDDIATYVKKSEECQRSKYDSSPYLRLPQPLAILNRSWTMNFIIIHVKREKTVIWMVVDRFTKYAYFIRVSHPYSAANIAQLFLDNIYKLHIMSKTIMCDRDPMFVSKIWQELLSATLRTWTTYHSQSDRQTEVLNRILQTYLRYYIDLPQRLISFSCY